MSKQREINSSNSKSNSQYYNECEKLSKNLFKNKNLKHQLKYSSPSYYTNTSINKTNSSIIKNKIATPNVTVFLDNNIQYNNDKKKNEQKKNISRNIKYNKNNTSLNKMNKYTSINKMKKRIDLLKQNNCSKVTISSNNNNINNTFNNSTNK